MKSPRPSDSPSSKRTRKVKIISAEAGRRIKENANIKRMLENSYKRLGPGDQYKAKQEEKLLQLRRTLSETEREVQKRLLEAEQSFEEARVNLEQWLASRKQPGVQEEPSEIAEKEKLLRQVLEEQERLAGIRADLYLPPQRTERELEKPLGVKEPASYGTILPDERRPAGATPAVVNLDSRACALTKVDFIQEAKAQGVSRDTLHRLILDITGPRTPWRGTEPKPPELRHLSSIQFMLKVYDDVIDKVFKDGKLVETIVYKDTIRRADDDLMTTVEVFLRDRTDNNKDLGEAEGITFISSRPTRQKKPGRKIAAPKAKPS